VLLLLLLLLLATTGDTFISMSPKSTCNKSDRNIHAQP
jgi:hypothetical protein